MNMRSQTSEGALFTSSDLGCSAALVSAGFDLLDLDKSNPRRAVFVFNLTEALLQAEKEFWSGRLMVSAKAYFDCIKMLKSRIYGASR